MQFDRFASRSNHKITTYKIHLNAALFTLCTYIRAKIDNNGLHKVISLFSGDILGTNFRNSRHNHRAKMYKRDFEDLKNRLPLLLIILKRMFRRVRGT